MEDIEYTTCVPFAVTVADELEEQWAVRGGRWAVEHREPAPWVMQEEGDA
jgi:hypothetical protein